jgi:hypothetical protein
MRRFMKTELSGARSGSDYGTARRRDCGRGALYSGHNMAKWCKFARARGIACGGWSTLTSSCGEADASRPAWQGMTAGSQEEGEYEEVADRHDNSGGEEPRIEPAILVQPLGEAAGEPPPDEATTDTVPLCERNIVASAGNACSRDAGGVGDRREDGGSWKALTKDERGTNPDEFCDLASGPGLISGIAGSPIGVFVAVGCAAKATSEAF